VKRTETSQMFRQKLRDKSKSRESGTVPPLLIERFQAQVKKDHEAKVTLEKLARLKPKRKPRKAKARNKEWDAAAGLEYPIYLFTYSGKRIGKAKNRKELTEMGVSGVSAAVSIREKTMFRGCYLSYNKKIKLSDYKATPLKLVV